MLLRQCGHSIVSSRVTIPIWKPQAKAKVLEYQGESTVVMNRQRCQSFYFTEEA